MYHEACDCDSTRQRFEFTREEFSKIILNLRSTYHVTYSFHGHNSNTATTPKIVDVVQNI